MKKTLFLLSLIFCSLLPLRAQYPLRLDDPGISLQMPGSSSHTTRKRDTLQAGVSTQSFISTTHTGDVFGLLCMIIPDSVAQILGADISRELLMAAEKGIVDENGRDIVKRKTRSEGERQIVDMRYRDPGAVGRIHIVYTGKPKAMMVVLIYATKGKEDKKAWKRYSQSLKISQ